MSIEAASVSQSAHRNIRHIFSRVTRVFSMGALWVLGLLGPAMALHAADASGPNVFPAEVKLTGNFSQCQLLVTEGDLQFDRTADATHAATYASSNPGIVTISANGRLLARGNGSAKITVTLGKQTREVPVVVSRVAESPVMSFEAIQPVISKLGCNAGACHASQHGKGGFTLSVFGFDPDLDHHALVRDRMQRRLNFNVPRESLLLRKPTLEVPHGGGKRLKAGSVDFQMLEAWVASGAAKPVAKPVTVTKVTLTPTSRLMGPSATQQLRLEAEFSDGSVADVTPWAKFDSMDDGVFAVDADGKLKTTGRGEAACLVRYEGHAGVCMVTVPFGSDIKLDAWKSQNIVDELALAKFKSLGIEPSRQCDDATFLRRAFLDATGSLPTIEETNAFLASTDPQKRVQLVDRLLGLTGDPSKDIYNDRYAAHWTLKWADLIRNKSATLGDQGMWALHNWLLESFRTNKKFDRFVRELVTAQGSCFSHGPANYYRIASNPPDLAESTAQLFLGVRLQCAKCHHHPFEKYGQEDYYAFAAFFSRVKTKNSQEFGIFGRETVVTVQPTGEVTHPKTRKVLPPTPLEGKPIDHELDRRIALADWMTSKENDYFARNIANRYMAYLLGRGLVEPIDDMRATNPASNAPLLDALVAEFRKNDFDVKRMMRMIMTSRLYQLDSQPTADNVKDSRFYSFYRVKRIGAEALMDAVDYATGSQTKYPDLPLGTRAIELPDAEYKNAFLMAFGKPKRSSVCECERVPDENLVQALHTLNGDILATKLSAADSRIATLIKQKKSHDDIVTELFLVTLCRAPTNAERAFAQKLKVEAPTPQEGYEDLLWTLINSKPFLFVH